MDMKWKDVGALLPKQPCEELVEYLLTDIYDNSSLGKNLLLYNRESVETVNPLLRTMTPEDMERRERSRKRHWGARCTCTMCGEDFVTGYKKSGIIITMGEDGTECEGWTQEGAENAIVREDGCRICCPRCFSEVTVTSRRDLRRGLTNQILQAEVVNVEGYTAVMYWMVKRYQDATGRDEVRFKPHQALVIDRGGKLRRFRAERFGCEETEIDWRPCTRVCDPMQQPYYCRGAVNDRGIGGWVWTIGQELDGNTGEKTALDKYIGVGGEWPGTYLRLWQRWPQVENLMRQGFAKAVRQEIDERLGRAAYDSDLCEVPPITWVDWREMKPHRMLGMSKEAFRILRDAKWNADSARVWMLWRMVLPGVDATVYEMCREKIGEKGVRSLLEMMQAGWNEFNPVRVVRYLEKKALLRDGVQHLIDYRVMLRDAGLAETEETLWPRDLLEAHDRVAEMLARKRGISGKGNFAVTRIKLDGLEWTDGRLCIVIPKSEQELKDEGRILRHCVGTYGEKHCGGSPVFFVRHYRRPERSYYTLNIDMTGKEPKRIQLHGYGNERHGTHKQYIHSIPREVLQFCDRWEREILMPWWNRKRKLDTEQGEPAKKKARKRKKGKVTAA